MSAEKSQGLLDNVLKYRLGEVIFKSSVVYNNIARSCGNEANAGDSLLSSACTPKLQFFL